jgi:hypothetical protein
VAFSRRLQEQGGNEEIALVIADQRMPEMTGNSQPRPFNRPDSQTGAVDRMGDREASPTIPSLCPRARQLPLQAVAPKIHHTRSLASFWRNGRGFTAQEWS